MNRIPLRVTVHEKWDEIALDVAPTTTVTDVKTRALIAAKVVRPAEEFLVKFRGAEVDEDNTTVGEAGFVANGALIVLRRRRAAVR